MFYKKNDENFIIPAEGTELKTLTHGDRMSLTEFRLSKGCNVPAHGHPHEQIGYLVSGRIDLKIGEDVHKVEIGDSWCVPSGVEHSAIVHEDSVAIEVFAPVREDYLP